MYARVVCPQMCFKYDEECACQVARDVWNGLCNLELMQTLVGVKSIMVCMGMIYDVFNETLHQKNTACLILGSRGGWLSQIA